MKGELLKEGLIQEASEEDTPTVLVVDNPSRMPDKDRQQHTLEPYVRLEVIAPTEYTGPLMDLANERRGELVDMKYLTPTRTTVIYQMPLAEVITDFFDQVKSRTRGYASMEYALSGYRESPLVRLDVMINKELAAPLSTVVHEQDAQAAGKVLVRKLKEFIPRQMFKVPIQACVGANIVASVQLSAMRKDVLAKCYGGDISRKKKLLQKQAKGKKRMKAMGKVTVPQEAFMAVLNPGLGGDCSTQILTSARTFSSPCSIVSGGKWLCCVSVPGAGSWTPRPTAPCMTGSWPAPTSLVRWRRPSSARLTCVSACCRVQSSFALNSR